jgi:hypothetical protein
MKNSGSVILAVTDCLFCKNLINENQIDRRPTCALDVGLPSLWLLNTHRDIKHLKP